MAYNTKVIANFFLDLGTIDGEVITPMKLQKLIFYAHGWYLALTGKPLIEDNIEAWQYGPVVPSVYHEFKRFGNEPITSPAQELDLDEDTVVVTTPELPTGEMHSDVRALLKRVWEVYKEYSAVQLSNMTHAPGSPWSQALAPHQGKVPYKLIIDNDVIRKYFVARTTAA